MIEFPIDFVVTWVDGSDKKWIEKKNKYSIQAGTSKKSMSSEKAYRDWGTFKYWFRGVEKYASWVNHIYLVTDNQVPTWLDATSPKLTVVDHTDFIPKEYLPTFNSNAIEANLYRIEGLSEHFVVFNDDMYLTAPVKPSDFYSENGLPKYCTALNPIIPQRYGTANFQVNDMEIITSHFSKEEIIKNSKLLDLKQGYKNVLRTLIYKQSKFIIGFWENHLPYPFLKSTIQKIWHLEQSALVTTSKNKFRAKTDTNLWLFKYWQIASGCYAVADNKLGKLLSLDNADDKFWNQIRKKKYTICVVNDGFKVNDFEKTNLNFVNTFEEMFPEKSSFEK